MGNCCHLLTVNRNVSTSNSQRQIVLLLVGLDNAGKTSTAKGLIGESMDSVVPTVGFSTIALTYQRYSVIIYDLGGGPQIRGIWHRYFVDVHGIIFVVDASDVARLDECQKVLENLLCHEKLSGKPLLVLANKQDQQGALDELDIVEKLDVERIVNEQRSPTMVETCSATDVRNSKRKIDPGIRNGFKWLLNCIIRDYVELNNRVQTDVTEQKLIIEKERKERLDRIMRNRQKLGSGDSSTRYNAKEEEDEVFNHNPFRPIHEVAEKAVENGGLRKNEEKIIFVKESPHKLKSATAEDRGNGSNIQHIEMDGSDSASILSDTSKPPITELIKDQLEMDIMQPKKRTFLRRSNKTGPAPLHNFLQSSNPTKEHPQLCNGQVENTTQNFVLTSPRATVQLPPLKHSSRPTDRIPWAKPAVSSHPGDGQTVDNAWDLDKSLDTVLTNVEPSNKIATGDVTAKTP